MYHCLQSIINKIIVNMDSCIQLMSSQEYQKFKNYFDDKKQPKDLISFSDFSSIVRNSSYFEQSRVGPFLDSIKKELKAKINTESDSGIMLNETDYFKYIKTLVIEHHKNKNENDAEFRKMFDLLCGGNETIRKKSLMDILENFGVSINYDQFFSPIGKKDSLEFEDFCCLFKSNEDKELFKQTFSNGFKKDEDNKDVSYAFPIYTTK